MKLYTRTGDAGETGLLDGSRVSKADPRVEAFGEVDELCGWLGVVRAGGVDGEVDDLLRSVQRDLFALGARLADPRGRIGERVAKAGMAEEDVTRLEGWIDRAEAELPALTRFILPGGSPAGAALHVARCVCRRAERRVVGLGSEALSAVELAYLNRLSDLLFVLARVVNHRAGRPETEW